jgi:hypothetical protein
LRILSYYYYYSKIKWWSAPIITYNNKQ